MVKFKTKLKNGQIYVKAKLSSGDEINGMEYNILLNDGIRGLLVPERKKKNVIVYTGSASGSLYDRLKKPVTQYEFFSILLQATEMIKNMRDSRLFLNNLILDLRYTFINEMRNELQFIYTPIIAQHVHANTVGFIEAIVYMAIPVADQNRDYIDDFGQFLKSLNTFDTNAIEDYITSKDRSFKQQIKKKNYSTGTSGRKDEPGQDDDNTPTMILNEMEDTTSLDQTEDTAILCGSEDTMALDDDSTTMLDEEVKPIRKVVYASLVRTLTNETVSINKPVFRIGKERSYVDYFVANNNAVSRSHADIITRNGKYYIQDLNSKNRTFVNGQAIPVRYEKEIFDGDEIRLANEEFIFYAN